MKSVGVIALLCIFAGAAAADTSGADTSGKDVIAVVLGKKIRVEDGDRLSGLVLGELLDRFARDNGIEPTDREIEVFVQRSEEMQRQQRLQMEQDRKDLVAELQAPFLSAHDRKEKESRLQTIESILRSNRKMRETAREEKQLLTIKRRIAWRFVRSWKINKALYARYGGRVIFQQAGAEPIDAYRDFLREQERSGTFRILDKNYEASFWRYYTDDAMHVFYPESEGTRFINIPWWMMDRTPER